MRFFALSIALVAGGLFAPVPIVAAQSVESFFDIFTEVAVPDPACDRCKAIEKEIADIQQVVDEIIGEMLVIDSAINMIDDAIRLGEENLRSLEKQLQEMSNPKNFVESEGRRLDSSDHAALQRRNVNLWKAYKGGRMTAEEYSEEISKPFDDPSIADDLEMLKEILIDELKDGIEDVKKSIDDAKNLRDEMNEEGNALSQELDLENSILAGYMDALEDCNKRCKVEDVNVIEDYELTPDQKSLMQGLVDFFRGLLKKDEPVSPFEGLDEAIKELEHAAAGGAEGDQPTETMGLNFEKPFAVPDSFFDVFVDLQLPPATCHLCDPLRSELAELQAILQAERSEQAHLEASLAALRAQWANALAVRDEARKALDRLDNPSASAESEGRRMDSNDQAAMNVRNAGLWARYKHGDISAQELESEWSKPFDDPAVREELEDIKEHMREQLEEAVQSTEAVMKKLDEAMRGAPERLVELAGSIAGKQVLLDYLLKQIEECEKKCREPLAQDASDGVFNGYEKFIFPEIQGEPEMMQYSSVNADTSRDDGDQGGLMDWFKGFFGGDDEQEEEGEDPEEEEQSRSAASEERTSESVSSSGASDDDEDEEEFDEDEDDGARSSAPASSKAAVSSSVGKSSSAKTSAKAECDTGTMTKDACEDSCSGTCYESYEEFDGLKCFKCVGTQASSVAKEQCDPPTETEASCRKDCFGTCSKVYTRKDGVKCFECIAAEEEEDDQEASSSRPQTATCPSGQVSDKSICDSQCASQGGTCVQENGCYSCVVVNCPNGTHKNECPSSCANGCDVVGTQDGVSCYQCKQSCEETCSKNGYGPETTDHSNAILADLQQYSCVSGAGITIQTAKIGSCNCIGEYSISVDQTKPVCKGSPCGDVVCGSSAQCADGDTTITVSCNWQGWQKVQKHQFKPVFGQ